MAGVRPIRITAADRAEYARLAGNAKAKIRRVEKKYGLDLRAEVPLPGVDSFSSRKEFNDWKEQVSSFNSRYNTNYQFVENKYGVVASKAEINKITRDTQAAQRMAKKKLNEIKEKPLIAQGKKQGTVGQQMLQMGKPNSSEIYVPPDFDFSKIVDRRQLRKRAESMSKRSQKDYFDQRMEQLKENFIDALNKTFNSDAHELAEMVAAMDARDFFEMYNSYNDFKIPSVYTSKLAGEDPERYVEKMMADIELYQRGHNSDLRGF